MMSETAREGCRVVVFQWSTAHGDCEDCGLPAAFLSARYGDHSGQLCVVCAANDAVDGMTITRMGETDE